MPRPLSPRESEILDFLLGADFPGVETLRTQARTARVVGQCECGCATVYLAVDPALPVASEVAQFDAVDAQSRSVCDWDPPRELILFVKEGRLSSIEIVWYGDAPIPDFPPVDTFEAPTALWRPRPE
jgi:hypothetical protein